MNITGRFTVADRTPDAVIVGLIGSATLDRLTADNIDHIRAFYNMPGSRYELAKTYPDKLKKGPFNGFVLLYRDERGG